MEVWAQTRSATRTIWPGLPLDSMMDGAEQPGKSGFAYRLMHRGLSVCAKKNRSIVRIGTDGVLPA